MMGDDESIGSGTPVLAGWCAEMFDHLNEEWDEVASTLDSRPAIDFVRSLERRLPQGDVLDLCCGQGRLLRGLSQLGRRVVAVDRSLVQLRRAAPIARALGNVSLIGADMRQLPFKHQSAFLALSLRCYTSLGYVPPADEVRMLEDLRRVTVPRGMVIVDSFNWDWIVKDGPIRRSRRSGAVTLTEEYKALHSDKVIESAWTYSYADGRPPHRIDFALFGYDAADVTRLFGVSGWTSVQILDGYGGEPVRGPVTPAERLIAVATRD